MSDDAFEKDECYICRAPANLGPDGGIRRCECKRCGRYGYDRTEFDLHSANEDILIRVSGWVRDQNRVGIEPIISLEDFRRIKASKLPELRIRAGRLLQVIHNDHPLPNTWFSLYNLVETAPEWLGVTFSKSEGDIDILLRILEREGYVDGNDGMWTITVGGILRIEEVAISGAGFVQGFVAMSFSGDMDAAWKSGFDPAIHDAGYLPMRIDGKEYLGGISDEIIVEIRKSAFVIADYTQQKNGVYFEAGFALGMGLRVIPTVRSDEVDKLHFDIKHLNTIVWTDPADLRKRLSKRIEAVIGRGPH